LRLAEPVSGRFLHVGGFHFDAVAVLIPMEDVTELTERYGNFQRCKSAGALESKKHMRYLAFLAQDEATREEVLKASKVSMSGKNTVIEFTGETAKIKKHEMEHNGKMVPFRYDGKERHVLLSSFRIFKEDFSG